MDEPKTFKVPCLVAYHACGCMSLAINLELSDEGDIRDFHEKALGRMTRVVKYDVGDPVIPWECDSHRSARLARLARAPSAQTARAVKASPRSPSLPPA